MSKPKNKLVTITLLIHTYLKTYQNNDLVIFIKKLHI